MSERPKYVYGYDAFGNQVSITDPLGRVSRFTYDAQGNQLSRTLPLGVETTDIPDDFIETFVYDERGRLARHTSFEERVKKSVYDAQTGRLVEQLFFENPDSYGRFDNDQDGPDETWSYKYDAFGRQVEAKQNDGVTVRTTATIYDGEGRVASITSPEGVLHYEYDDLGRRTRTHTVAPADPLNVTNDTRYTHDVLGAAEDGGGV